MALQFPRNQPHWVALKSDGTVYAGQPAIHPVRHALVAAVLWAVVSKNFNWNR